MVADRTAASTAAVEPCTTRGAGSATTSGSGIVSVDWELGAWRRELMRNRVSGKVISQVCEKSSSVLEPSYSEVAAESYLSTIMFRAR